MSDQTTYGTRSIDPELLMLLIENIGLDDPTPADGIRSMEDSMDRLHDLMATYLPLNIIVLPEGEMAGSPSDVELKFTILLGTSPIMGSYLVDGDPNTSMSLFIEKSHALATLIVDIVF